MNTPVDTTRQAQSGRRTLCSMGLAYALGTFNDNFFKQAGLMLAATAALTDIQGRATVFFALPFVLFSAWTGWLADRLPKRRLVIWSKALEIAAMLAALWCLISLNWTGMIAVVFLTGLQSTIFSPALNGAIPELFPARDVPGVNAYMKLATTATILLGIALAGVMLELAVPEGLRSLVSPLFPTEGVYASGRLLVGGTALLVAVVGFAASFGIPKTPTPPAIYLEGTLAPFPFLGPLDSVRHALECRRNDRPLFIVLAGEAFFYTVSSFALLCITNFGIQELGFSLTQTSLLSVALMVGICIGSLLAGRYGTESWRRFMLPSGVAMGTGLLLALAAPLLPAGMALVYLVLLFTATGIAGGRYLIPLTSFIQARPKATEKGKVIAISNCAAFTGIILSGLVLEAAGGAPPSILLAAAGGVCLAFMAWAARGIKALPEATLADRSASPLCLFLRAVLSLRYKVTAKGLEAIPADGPILFLPNHPALIDPLIVYSCLAGIRPRPLADERQMRGAAGIAAKVSHAVLIPDLEKDGRAALSGVRQGLDAVTGALRGGDSVLLYPSGRIYRSARESLGGNSGAASIINAVPGLRVVLVRTTGLWGSSFSYAATGKAPQFFRCLVRGLLALLVNGVFFTPRRAVQVEFAAMDTLPGQTGTRVDGQVDKRVFNAWLETFYNQAQRPAAGIPLFFWQGRTPRLLAEKSDTAERRAPIDAAAVPTATRERVYAMLRQASGLDGGLEDGHVLDPGMALGRDIGLDSLATMLLALGLEREFGHAVPRPEELVSVGDCLAAALGQLSDRETEQPAPAAWFGSSTRVKAVDFAIPAGAPTIPHAFAALFRRPHSGAEIVLADRTTLLSRFSILVRAMVLARAIRTLPGERTGIILPSVPATVVVWLATLLAGKTPVFFNWSVGSANLSHCMRLAGVSHVLSAAAFMDKLAQSGLDAAALPASFILLEETAQKLGRADKILGFLAAFRVRLTGSLGGRLGRRPIPEHAAILFTSGSRKPCPRPCP